MNALKKSGIALATLAVAALTVFALSSTPALWADTAPTDDGSAAVSEVQAKLWQMRNIMHYARFEATPVENGVQVAVTSTDSELTGAIRSQFGTGNDLPAPFPGSKAVSAEREGGVTLTFSAEDKALVSTLQAQGAGLAYGLLRNNMHAVMTALWANGNANVPGQRGAWMHGRGMMGGGMMGGGWMHGPGYGYGPGQGYGPRGGMMGPGYGPGAGQGPAAQQQAQPAN